MDTLTFIPATGPQVAFLNLLLAQRDIDGEETLRVQNLIATGALDKGDASDLINDFKKAPKRPTQTTAEVEDGYYTDPHGTIWQVVTSKGGNKYAKELCVTEAPAMHCKGHYDILDGSYFECGKRFPTTEQQKDLSDVEDEDMPVRDFGCYDPENYPKPKGKFVFRQGAIKAANTWTPLSLEKAAEFGKKTGVCCMCGRTLTKTESIEAGIGPICAGGF